MSIPIMLGSQHMAQVPVQTPANLQICLTPVAPPGKFVPTRFPSRLNPKLFHMTLLGSYIFQHRHPNQFHVYKRWNPALTFPSLKLQQFLYSWQLTSLCFPGTQICDFRNSKTEQFLYSWQLTSLCFPGSSFNLLHPTPLLILKL